MIFLGGVAAAALALWVMAPVIWPAVTGPVHLPAGARECPNCGPRPEDDAKFCSNCGSALGADRPA
jgi:hypothetical protein